MSNLCQDCKRELFGRIDKKFCSDQCRTSYNNKMNREFNLCLRKVHRILKKNRNILHNLNPNGKLKLHRDKLVEKGFSFDYFTNQYSTKKGTVYYFCYDQGYVFLEKDMIALVIRKAYLDK